MEKYLMKAASRMGIAMSPAQAEKFKRYHALLVAANKEMNLTRVSDDIAEACDRNYLDSLTLLTHLGQAKTLIDVGSGAGFPGVPLAILRPDMEITLLDSLAKRVDFLSNVIGELELNARAVHLRCEDAAKQPLYRDSFDIATARAVASMDVLSEWLLPFVKAGGRMLALKGPSAQEECAEAAFALESLNGKLSYIAQAQIPGRDWEHKIVCIEKTGATPDKFPRKPGMAEKRPLKQQVRT
ncbi:MAG: 16S rRNA (guanine(527)-N(7))-methyltransferase RsmG [Clostridia bacterium]|nr:16S rRNA (guanine(527)-N(7))-methyltransferase RsmG [Clostridia bacterium]